MARVTGIGGVFIKARNPDVMIAWYREHLGLDIQPWGGTTFHWHTPEAPNPDGVTAWSIFPEDSDYFAPSEAPFMINYRVADLRAVLADLQAEGCEVVGEPQESDYGRFGWVMDPEGNKVELWEPPA